MADVTPARAQSVDSPERGFHPSGSYALSDLETISMSGGNLSMRAPLAGLPAGRGGLSASLNLIYNSKVWDTLHSTTPAPECMPGMPCEPEPPRQIETLSRSDEGGWRYGFKYELELFYRDYSPPFDQQNYNVCADLSAVYYYQLRMSFPDGATRTFALQGQQSVEGYYAYKPDVVAVRDPGPPDRHDDLLHDRRQLLAARRAARRRHELCEQPLDTLLPGRPSRDGRQRPAAHLRP
jgi:hypothetical protein